MASAAPARADRWWRRVTRPLVVGSALAVAVAVVVDFLPSSLASHVSADITATAAAGAVAVCVVTGVRSSGAQRLWRLFYGAAQASIMLVAVLTALSRASPAAWSDLLNVISFVAHPLALAALLTYPTVALDGDAARDQGAQWRLVVLLDCLVVVGSIAFLGWELVVPNLGLSAYAGISVDFVAYSSIGNLVLLTAGALLLAFRRAPSGRGLSYLVANIAVLTATRVGYLAAAPHGLRLSAPLIAGIMLSPLLLSAACLVTPRHANQDRALSAQPPDSPAVAATTAPERSMRVGQVWSHAVVPYVALAAVGVVILTMAASGRRLSVVETAWLALLLLLTVVRQMIISVDNSRLLVRVRRSERRLRYLAFHDPLTGLANRALFGDRIDLALARRARTWEPVTVIFCDLDGFKAVNDTYSHETGDQLLRVIAARLRAATRPADTVARLGGDEFAVLVEGADPDEIMGRLRDEVGYPCELDGRRHDIAVSIGYASAPPGPASASGLLRAADLSMYEAKRRRQRSSRPAPTP